MNWKLIKDWTLTIILLPVFCLIYIALLLLAMFMLVVGIFQAGWNEVTRR